MTVLAVGIIESHTLREGKRRATEAQVTRLVSVPRAQTGQSHCCTRERATAQHRHTTTSALIHSLIRHDAWVPSQDFKLEN